MATITRFPLEELVRLPSFLLPSTSFDGRKVAYFSDASGRMELWVMDLETGAEKQVSNGQLPRSLHAGFIWDRAGKALVFGRDEDGDEKHDLWALDVETGEATQLTNVSDAQEFPVEFSPDDQWISFLSTRNGQLNLFKMRRDGSEVMQLTAFANPVWGGAGQWSPDGTQLIACANESSDLKNQDVYLVSADGGSPRRIFRSKEGAHDTAVAWSPDGRLLALSSDESGVNRAGVLDPESGEVRWFGAEGVEEYARSFSPEGYLLAIRNRDARLQPVVYEVGSGAERLPTLPAAASLMMQLDVDFAQEGRALTMRYSTDSSPAALLLYDLDSADTRTLIEPRFGSIDPQAFVTSEDVLYPSFDGRDIPALLYRPRGIAEGDQVPAIVMPHGGPTWQYFHGFDPYVQFLVNEGYAVLLPNIRGSTGYGVEFRDMALNDWGGADLQDIVSGRDYLAELPFVDGDRIAVFGGSYGGFMTYIALTKSPDRWKAGVAWVGITDLKAMYEESMPHFKYFLRQQMGDPDENADLWADRSAANFADRLTAKLLIVHGVNDPRCPISQARIFRDRLLELGKQEGRDFEYVELGEEGHGSTDQDQRLRAFTLVADFFHRNL